jgi:hypothetical protein
MMYLMPGTTSGHLSVQLVQLDSQVQPVQLDQWGLLEQQARKVLQVHRVKLVHREGKAFKVRLARQVLKVFKAKQVLQALLVLLDHKAQQA